MENKNIVIIGTTHHNTLGVVRSFGMSGFLVDVILHDGNIDSFVLKSKYIRKSDIVDSAPAALALLGEKYNNAVVIACSDYVSSLMDANYDRLEKRFVFFHCDTQGKVTKLMNKKVQIQMAENAGFSVPVSFVNQEFDIDTWQYYPCIVKPLASAVGGKFLKICRDKDSLREILEVYSEQNSVLIQQMIDIKKEIVILGISVGGIVYISGVIYKHRELIGGTTYSTVKDIDSIPLSLIEACKSLVKSSSYEGLFGIECAFDGHDYQFIEINYRTDATTYSLCVAGKNLLLAYYQYIIGDRNWLLQINSKVREIDSIVELRDIIHVIKRKVGVFRWLKEYRRSKCRYFGVKGDMKPFYAERNKMVRNFICKIL